MRDELRFRDDLFPIGLVPHDVSRRSAEHALGILAATGLSGFEPLTDHSHVWVTDETVLRVPSYRHERLSVLLDFDRAAASAGVPRSHVLLAGTAADVGWWAVLRRIHGLSRPTFDEEAAHTELFECMARLHQAPLSGSSRWGDPGTVGIFLAVTYVAEPDVYPKLASAFFDRTSSMPVVPIHGDVSVEHNALWSNKGLAALIDPGAISSGPAALDFAWASAMSCARGVSAEAVLSWVPVGVRHEVRDLLPLAVRRAVSLARLRRDEPAEEFCRAALLELGTPGREWID